MKIAIITPAHPLRGGIAASGERLARQFQTEGDNVTIFTFSLQYPNFLFPGKTQYSDEAAPTGLPIRVIINSVNPITWVKTARAIIREKPDLIICRFWLPIMAPALGTILRIVKRSTAAKICALVDNIIPHEKRIGDIPFARYFTSAVDSFVVMSRSVEEELRTFTKTKTIRYVPHPIYDIYGKPVERQEALNRLNLPSDKKYLLFFGFVRAYKGLDLAIEALAKVPDKNIHLLIAGEFYEDEAPYQKLIADNNLQDRITIHSDFIPTDDVKYYFAAADLIVQPYKSATQSGISQIAYHFDKPMIVTNVGGLPEIVFNGEAGYVAQPTPESIAHAITDFYQNDRADTYIQKVREYKQHFSWAAMTSAFRTLAATD